MRAYERFLEYVKFATQSDEECENCPSTPGQLVFGRYLVEELRKAGAADAEMDGRGYVYASLPASEEMEGKPAVGFIAHLDTAPAFFGAGIKPVLISDYDGNDIILNKENGVVLKVSEFGHLKDYVGQSLIVTDGTTLLGSDDKAGIAEIMTALAKITKEQIPHGPVKIAFTPDEEIGRGADFFDVKRFGADYAYTVDGGKLGEIEYENFNAASAKIIIHGVNIHPGEAKNKMKNAALLSMEFNGMLPASEIPACTEGYEGFYHLCSMKGDESEAVLSYIIRDHSMEKFEKRKDFIRGIGEYLNKKYGAGMVETEIVDSYYNMKEKILPFMYIVENAKKAMEKCGVEPVTVPIRGGTDGARLSFMGLPCPNLSTGGHNFHGKYEYIPVESMDGMVDVLVELMGQNI